MLKRPCPLARSTGRVFTGQRLLVGCDRSCEQVLGRDGFARMAPSFAQIRGSFPQAVAFGESKFLHDMLARVVSRFSSGIGCFRGVEV